MIIITHISGFPENVELIDDSGFSHTFIEVE